MAQTEKRLLNKSKYYQSFVLARDKALERLHARAQHEITDSLGGALQRVMEIVSYWYSRAHNSILLLKHIDQLIDVAFASAQKEMIGTILKLRAQSFALANAGETEAMSRATGQAMKIVLNKSRIEASVDREMPSGGTVQDRVKLYLDRIKRDILDAIQLSAITEETLSEAQERLLKAFPSVKYVKREPKNIFEPKLKEADYPSILGFESPDDESSQMKPVSISTGFIDDDTWKSVIDDYQNEYIPKWRGPEGELDVQLGEGTPRYAWELEREMTQDFVQQVRNGEHAAAKENGITDFIWIAVVDNKTDKCCLWRDGLTTKEIEVALKGEHRDDECETTTPPAHFNCRCRLAPATEGMPEQPELNIGDFTAWLDQTVS